MREVKNQIKSKLITKEAIDFIIELHRKFENKRQTLLYKRKIIQSEINISFNLERDFKTSDIRNDSKWRVAEIPEVLKNRKVDIVCLDVANKQCLLECLESGANGIQVDFDDGYSPSWSNNLKSQLNLYQVIHESDDKYHSDKYPLLLMRPRSLNLDEYHLMIDGQPVSGGFFDLGLYLYWNGKKLYDSGRGPFFYLPKLENHNEASLYSEVLQYCESRLQLPKGSIKVIVLIENILASYHMEEMIYELRDNIVALNTGRWDYIFSFIKKYSLSPDHILPAKSSLGLDQPFLQSYYGLLVSTAHKRGCLATGGMSPQFNNEKDLSEKEKLTVFNGKKQEALMGFDGALVAHRSVVDVCRKAFNSVIGSHLSNTQSQVSKYNSLFDPVQSQKYFHMLSDVPKGYPVTEKDIKDSVSTLYLYLYNWIYLEKGAVEMNGIIEDLASIEINRALLWKWLKSQIILKEGTTVSHQLVQSILDSVKLEYQSQVPNEQHQLKLEFLIQVLLFSQDFIDFMPTLIYPILVQENSSIFIKSNL